MHPEVLGRTPGIPGLDILPHRLSEPLRQLLRQELAVGRRLRRARPQRHRSRHTEGDPGPLHVSFVGAEPQIDGGAQGGGRG